MDSMSITTASPKIRHIARVKVGQTRSELFVDLKNLHRYGPWCGLAPDGSALFVRDVSSDEIYSLEVELP